jgi:hypothetical protein
MWQRVVCQAMRPRDFALDAAEGIVVSNLPALLATGADITVITARVAEELHLIPLDEKPIGGFDGRVTWLSLPGSIGAEASHAAFVIVLTARRDEVQPSSRIQLATHRSVLGSVRRMSLG